MVPGIFDSSLADENVTVETETAQRIVRALARDEGLLSGPSAGANVSAALRLAERLNARGETGVIVTVLCDSGERYLDELFWRQPAP